VLSQLPLYPGATEARVPYSKGEPYSNAGSNAAESGPFRGYWTAHTYTLPLGARSDLVLSFTASTSPGGLTSLRRDRAARSPFAAIERCLT